MLAAYNLIPVTWIPVSETWKVILTRLGLGLLAVLYRDALCAIFAAKSTA